MIDIVQAFGIALALSVFAGGLVCWLIVRQF